MLGVGKIAAIVLIGLLLLSFFRKSFPKLILIVLLIGLLLLLIRWIADLYWYGKDRGEW